MAFFVALRPNAGHGLLILEVSRSHNDALQSVGLLWTGDQLVAETSTWQHSTLTTNKYPCPGGIRTHDLSRPAAADLPLRPRGHWDRQFMAYRLQKCLLTSCIWVRRFTRPSKGSTAKRELRTPGLMFILSGLTNKSLHHSHFWKLGPGRIHSFLLTSAIYTGEQWNV
jgi:hypothetical protein